MPAHLTLAVAQSPTLVNNAESLATLNRTATHAASRGVDILLFPEAYLGGFPRTCNFDTSFGDRGPLGREQFLAYFQGAVDFGDTPTGAGDDWVERRLPKAKGKDVRGDGTRETLEEIARRTGVFLIVGAIERAGGSLYCACVYVCPHAGCLGKRRKVQPTGAERLVWAQGSPATLRAVSTQIRGVCVTLAAAICWENYMPLLRQSLYSQNINLYLAPTADARDAWVSLIRTIGCEGRCFVLSANQCTRQRDLPLWITQAQTRQSTAVGGPARDTISPLPGKQAEQSRRRTSIISKTVEGHEISWPLSTSTSIVDQSHGQDMTQSDEDDRGGEQLNGDMASVKTSRPTENRSFDAQCEDKNENEFICRGGSCIVGPFGEVLAGPLWETQEDGDGSGMLVTEVDFEDCERGRLDLDVAGSYARNDSFELRVAGLDTNPPPV